MGKTVPNACVIDEKSRSQYGALALMIILNSRWWPMEILVRSEEYRKPAVLVIA